MHSSFKKACPHIFVQRVENLIDTGTPDSWMACGKSGWWAELKQLSRKPVTKFKMPWRPGQLAWYKRMRKKSKVPYFVFLTLDKSWYLLNSALIEMKEHYTMKEIEPFFICEDAQLKLHQYALTLALGIKL